MILLTLAYLWFSVLARTLPQSPAKLPLNFEMAVSTDSLNIPGWIYVGCITDNVTNRTLANNVQTDNGDNVTIENCLSACQSNGYSYCGPEYGNQCWGDNSTASTGKLTDNGCTMPCQGESTEICGGSDRISLYRQTNVSNSTNPATPTGIPPSIEDSPVTMTMVTTIVLTTSTSLDSTETNIVENSFSLTVVPVETSFVTTIQSTITTTISGYASTSPTTPPSLSPSTNKATSAHAVAIVISTVIAALLLLGLGIIYLWLKIRKRSTKPQNPDINKTISDPMCAPTKPEWYDNGGGQVIYLGDDQLALQRFEETSPPPRPGSPNLQQTPQPPSAPETAQPAHPTPPRPNQSEPTSDYDLDDDDNLILVQWNESSIELPSGALRILANRVTKAWNREEARLMDMGALEGMESSEIQEAIMAELSEEMRAAVDELATLGWILRNNTASVYTHDDSFSRGGAEDFKDNGDVPEWL